MAENIQPEEQQDRQKQYLVEKFGSLLEQIGEGYGQPLQEELIRRLEKTIAEFDDEVSGLISDLKERSKKRHEELKRLWEQGPEQAQNESVAEEQSVAPEKESGEMSEWERRLEDKAQASKQPGQQEEKKQKKKGLFRKKSKE